MSGVSGHGGGWLWAAFVASTTLTMLLTIGVAAGVLRPVDDRMLELLRHRVPPRPDGKPRRATTVARDLTALGGDTLRIGFLLACMLLLACDRRWRVAVMLVVVFVSARIALFVTKAAVRRPRPPVAGETIVTYTSSFPSGHTFMAGVLFLSAALLIPDGQPAAVTGAAVALALGASLTIGLTRTSFAIHWPSDVAVGWLGSIAWTAGCILLFDALG